MTTVDTWPAGRAPDGPAHPYEAPPQGRNYPLGFDRDYRPAPAGGRPASLWRITLHNRQFDTSADWRKTLIAEIVGARGRRLETAWNTPASLTFTLDGDHPIAPYILELRTDVRAWRYDELLGRDVCMFRGIVCQSEDQITEQANVVVFTAKDYLAMLARRYTTTTFSMTFEQDDQDDIAGWLANYVALGVGTAWWPSSYLPMAMAFVNPNGSTRGPSKRLRDREYLPGTEAGQAFDDLARVSGGFDYDLAPAGSPVNPGTVDLVRIFYPSQGVVRDDPVLVYGSNVAGLTRTVASGDYANAWRVIGQAPTTGQPPMFREAWNRDATALPPSFGLWASVENAADVKNGNTLYEKAEGDLALSGILVPNYTITLRPGAYAYGRPNVGDVVRLIVQAGRLDVDTTVRVLGLGFDVGDDGQEDVVVTVGRPRVKVTHYLYKTQRDIDALVRR